VAFLTRDMTHYLYLLLIGASNPVWNDLEQGLVMGQVLPFTLQDLSVAK